MCPPSLETPSRVSGDYQIAPLPRCGKGRWRPLAAIWKYFCHEPKNRTALHFRAKAAALQEAETVQHSGEIYAAQRSRGKSKQDKQQVKPCKEIQKRSFWRRFFSSFLSLLKEKRPSETKGNGLPRARRALAMTGKKGRRGGRIAALVCTPRVLTSRRGLARNDTAARCKGGQSRPPLRKVYRSADGQGLSLRHGLWP